jgi:hypothetical protein
MKITATEELKAWLRREEIPFTEVPNSHSIVLTDCSDANDLFELGRQFERYQQRGY